MSDDIVSILRQHALAADTEVENCPYTDAADEIESLRTALNKERNEVARLNGLIRDHIAACNEVFARTKR